MDNLPVPTKVVGLNSRQSNKWSNENAKVMEKFTEHLNARTTFAVAQSDDLMLQDNLDLLYKWAKSDALTDTRKCAIGGRKLDTCTQYQQADLEDLSSQQDWNNVNQNMESMYLTYLVGMSDFKVADNAEKHKTIQGWFNKFQKDLPKSRFHSDVFFGLFLNWKLAEVINLTKDGNTADAQKLLAKTLDTLDRELMLDDGSLKDRTTRGVRALHYHHSALNEIVFAIYLAKNAGVTPDPNMTLKIDKAVQLWLDGVENPSYMDKWAKVAHNQLYQPGVQNLGGNFGAHNWWNLNFEMSWVHVYANWFPESPGAKRIKSNTNINAGNASATTDTLTGVALGCLSYIN
jgi:hypothetical protein